MSATEPMPPRPAGAGWLRALAPAKVNPWLHVLGRRADGFHELDLGMLALDLCDVLDARTSERPGVRLQVAGPQAEGVPTDDSNLAVRAAEAVLRAAARKRGAAEPACGLELRLEKRIPAEAGLGGGSSDAAAAAVLTRAVLGLDEARFPDLELAELVAALGSDCAFFVLAAKTGFAACKGRGEQVDPWPVPSTITRFVLLAPRVACSTAQVYSGLECSLFESAPRSSFAADRFWGGEDQARELLVNRLEQVALKTVPELRPWRELLDRVGGAHYRLSGSGSAWFGLYRDDERAQSDLHLLRSAGAERGLGLRGAWVCRPAGHGALVLPAGS